MKKPAWWAGALGAALWPLRVSAQSLFDDSLSRAVPDAMQYQAGPALLKLLVALVVIIVLIYATVLVLKRVMHGQTKGKLAAGSIEVLDRHYLSPKKQLCLIKVDKKFLLVGIAEQGINLVADVSDQNLLAKPTGAAQTPAGFSFKRLLADARGSLALARKPAESGPGN